MVVVDDMAPSVQCPEDIVQADEQVVAFDDSPPASDNSMLPVLSHCDRRSGQRFPFGVTTVECTAKDASNNVGRCSFEVIINGKPPPPP